MLQYTDNCDFNEGDIIIFEINDKTLGTNKFHFGTIVDVIMEDSGIILFKINPIFKLSTNISYYYRTCGELIKERERYLHMASENN